MKCGHCGTSAHLYTIDRGRLLCSDCELTWDGPDHMQESKRRNDYEDHLRETIVRLTRHYFPNTDHLEDDEVLRLAITVRTLP